MKEKEEQKLFFDPVFDATFEEAVEFMKEKLSLTPKEFYELDAKARFRAFTVAKLTGLDAIERVKEKLVKALEEGKTLKEWVEELGEDGILKSVGFHQSNPWYLETVFRTNISTAYNAGRLIQFSRFKDKIKYLEYVAIDDNRTTPICRRLDGTRLPPDDPFWATYTPPNHFNCRSTVRAIFKGSREAKTTRKRKPEGIPPIPEGFKGSPLNSWWKLTDSMAKRAVNYRIHGEILEKAKRLCQNNFADECPEWEEVKELIEKWKLQQEIEERFLKRLESFEWNSRKQIKANFPKLWETEEKYRWHVGKRIRDGHVSSEEEYIKRIFETLSEHTSVVIYEAPKWKSEEHWHRIFYSRKCSWIVIVSEKGSILSAFKVEEGKFSKSLKGLKDAGYKAYRGKENTQIKEIAKRILRRLDR